MKYIATVYLSVHDGMRLHAGNVSYHFGQKSLDGCWVETPAHTLRSTEQREVYLRTVKT